LSENLNHPSNLANKAALIVDSPTSLVGWGCGGGSGEGAGGWEHINSYTVVVKGSTFGGGGIRSGGDPEPAQLAAEDGHERAAHADDCTVINTALADGCNGERRHLYGERHRARGHRGGRDGGAVWGVRGAA